MNRVLYLQINKSVMAILLAIVFGLPSLFLIIEFINFLFYGKRIYNLIFTRILEFAGMIVLPLAYLVILDEDINDCCSDSATFSPEHRLTIFVFLILSVSFYFYSSFKSNVLSPIIEVITNSFLLFGFIFNIFIAIQVNSYFWLWGNIPVGILFVFQLIKNHNTFMELYANPRHLTDNVFDKWAWNILQQKLFFKIPLLLILFIPVFSLITSLLLLFGQKPDSIILAFTETYKHGFSQLNHLCENVECGGHFLCSVAANGHTTLVQPIRYGERGGHRIICNRQLLIANAFEELIQQKMPLAHAFIRKNYNKVGNAIHKHYHIFSIKLISDIIYILMKPFELIFLVVLYSFDQKPENRIARQYINADFKEALNKY